MEFEIEELVVRGVGRSRSWSFEECWYNGMIEICVPGLSMPKNKSVSIMLCHVEN